MLGRQTVLLPFGTYETIGGTYKLADDMKKYQIVAFRWGNETDQASGGGAYFTYAMGAYVYDGLMLGVLYNLNGQLITGTLQVVSGTEVKLLYGTRNPRLRAIIGFR